VGDRGATAGRWAAALARGWCGVQPATASVGLRILA
jgi:hypothetical protein